MDLLSSSDLNLIGDPEAGLALLAKCSAAKTPEQKQERQFWQVTDWRDWLAGDVLAVARGVNDCRACNRPPPFWLSKASLELGMQSMSAAERRARRDIQKHWHRWKAVMLVRGRHPNDPRNFKKKVRGDAVWKEAAKLLADNEPGVDPHTVKKSYALIRRAGGAQVTLPSYKRAIRKRDRQRKKIRVAS